MTPAEHSEALTRALLTESESLLERDRDSLDLVREFHDAAGIPTPDLPATNQIPEFNRHVKAELGFVGHNLRMAFRSLQGNSLDVVNNVSVRRVSLMLEELREFCDAVASNDLVGALDALVDLQYVLHGTVLEFGLLAVFDEAVLEVHRSNMSKAVVNVDGELRMQHAPNGKILKPEGWTQPDLKGILDRART